MITSSQRWVNVMAHLHVVEKGLEHQGAGVARVEEHEFGLLQVAGGQTVLTALRNHARQGRVNLVYSHHP